MVNINRKPLGKGNKKVVEKVEYKGEFRIVGTVWSGKEHVGYGVVDVKTYKLKLFTITQTFELLKRAKFENAEIVGTTVANTECSMHRLLKFDTKCNVIGNRGITILGKVYNPKGILLGFRIMDSYGNVVDINENDIIRVASKTEAGLLNGKEVDTGQSKHISAIRGNFKRIDLVEVEPEFVVPNVSEERAEFIKEMHKIYLGKATFGFYRELVINGGIKRLNSKSRQQKAKIVLNEFIFPKYPALKAAKNYDTGKDFSVSDILTAGLVQYLNDNGEYKNHLGMSTDILKPKKNTILVYRGRGQDEAKFDKVSFYFLEFLKTLGNSNQLIAFFRDRNNVLTGKCRQPEKTNVLHPVLRDLVMSFTNNRYHAWQKEDRASANRNGFKTNEIDYCDTSGVAHLGYTIDKNYVGKDFDSIIYGRKPLRYLFEGLEFDEEQEKFFLENINCFGDVEFTRSIDKYLGEATPEYIQFAEGLLFILAMHNPTIAKYVNSMYGNFSRLNISEISKEEFYLSEYDKLFYESGGKFNRARHLIRNQSWGDCKLNVIPQATYEAISIHVGRGSDFPKKAPYIYKNWNGIK